MSEWMCLKCGTMHDDMLKGIENAGIYKQDKVMKRVYEYEDRGEHVPENCSRCGAKRI